jgi:hypothetical protein
LTSIDREWINKGWNKCLVSYSYKREEVGWFNKVFLPQALSEDPKYGLIQHSNL